MTYWRVTCGAASADGAAAGADRRGAVPVGSGCGALAAGEFGAAEGASAAVASGAGWLQAEASAGPSTLRTTCAGVGGGGVRPLACRLGDGGAELAKLSIRRTKDQSMRVQLLVHCVFSPLLAMTAASRCEPLRPSSQSSAPSSECVPVQSTTAGSELSRIRQTAKRATWTNRIKKVALRS